MLTDTGEVDSDGDTSGGEDIAGTNTTELKDVRAADSTTSNNNFLVNLDGLHGCAPVRGVLDSGSLSASGGVGEDNLGDGCVSEDSKVGTVRERVDVSGTSVRTGPVGWVDGRCCDESTPVFTTVGVW